MLDLMMSVMVITKSRQTACVYRKAEQATERKLIVTQHQVRVASIGRQLSESKSIVR